MENQAARRKETIRRELKKIKQLHRAESFAWILFIGVGLMYILLATLIAID